MEIEVTYDESFSLEEKAKLKTFESILKKEWVPKANSTSPLDWVMAVSPVEPRLHAKLKVRTNGTILLSESINSILEKKVDMFEREFIRKALSYRPV